MNITLPYINQALEQQKIKHRASYQYLLETHPNQDMLTAVEIGTFKGVNAHYMLQGCLNLKLYCVDGYERVVLETGGANVTEIERQAILTCSNTLLIPFGERCVRIFKQSEIAYQDFPDGYFDYIYIDGEHLYEWVKRDIELWYPKLKVNGIFAGHDFEMAEVMCAVSEFRLNHKNLQFFFSTGGGESDWWFQKR